MENWERCHRGERAFAPVVAAVVTVLAVTVLMVVTDVTSRPKVKIEVEIARVEDDPTAFVPDDPADPPDPVETSEPSEVPEIAVDLPASVAAVDVGRVEQPTLAPNEPSSLKPAVEAVAQIKCVVTAKGVSHARAPGLRSKYTDGGARFGDATTERTVLKALRWLKKTQRADGSWNGNPISNTGLSVLTFLAHGETPASAEFGECVTKAIEYLVGAQAGDGEQVRFRGSDGNEYAFLIATYALCEAYGMTRNPNVREPAERGLARIVRNQSPTGGWDYRLNRSSTRDDMSYAGWALQALKAGKLAGLAPEGLDVCIKKAVSCLKKRNFRGGGFGYTAGGRPMGLTATGCLALQLLGFGDEPEVKAALEYMREWSPSFDAEKLSPKAEGACPQYYCYYAAQCKYQAGMKVGATPKDLRTWQRWNVAMKSLYPSTMITEGPVGHWTNEDKLGSGDTMATCLCALQLMVYYRYLPTARFESRPGRTERQPRSVRPEVAVDVDI